MPEGPIIMFLLLLLMGLVMFISAIISIRKARSTEFWRATTGKIISAEIKKSQRESSGQNSDFIYSPKLDYAYRVDEQEYVSSRIKIMNDYSSGSIKTVQKIIKKYRPDSEVMVYFNPEKPEKSVLEKGISRNSYVLLVISLIIIVCSLVFAEQFDIIDIISH